MLTWNSSPSNLAVRDDMGNTRLHRLLLVDDAASDVDLFLDLPSVLSVLTLDSSESTIAGQLRPGFIVSSVVELI